tara:strand:+ start:658 stop:1863 length:1206 start_codon:yes stop_codon:yes gene_type:complete
LKPTVTRALPLLLALTALTSGCVSYRSQDYSQRYATETALRRVISAPTTPRGEPQPTLEIGPLQTEAALVAYAQRQEHEAAKVQELGGEIAFRGSTLPIPELAKRARAHYARGQRDLATTWIDAHPSFREWDQAEDLVSVDATFVRASGEGVLELTIRRRSGVAGPLAVAFPPGTYALTSDSPQAPTPGASPLLPPQPDLLTFLADRDERWTNPDSDQRWGHWPRAQDLAFLQAPVVALRADQHATRIRVPVACADFDILAPEAGRSYRLARFEAGSAVDRLARELCARRADPREAQLAVWLAREDLDWATFTRRDGHRGQIATFQRGRSVLPRHAQGAARLLLDAGVDPRPMRFFLPELESAPAPTSTEELPELTPVPSPVPSPAEGETVARPQVASPLG